jgi:melanoma-associated antigen
MQLVEVMSRTERDAQENPAANDETSKKKAPTASKAYILRSILDPALIEVANTFDDDIRLEENNHPRIQNKDEDELELDCGGCILAWQFSDRLGSIGLLSVILSLILVNGKELTYGKVNRTDLIIYILRGL